MGNINDWITADKISGSAGETTVTLTCDANNTASSRSYTVDVTLNGSGEVAHCTINQERAFASTYWIVQYVYISTLKTVLEIREDSIDGTLRYKGTVDINKNVSWECDGVTTSSDTTVLDNLIKEMYTSYLASQEGGAIFNAAVIYRYTENNEDVNSYMQEVIKYPILYPQEVSSAYGSGSYRLLKAGNMSDTNASKEFVYVLNMDYSSSNYIYNLGLNYNSFCTIQNNITPKPDKYSILSYLPFLKINAFSLKNANLWGTTYFDATISNKKFRFHSCAIYCLSTDLRNGNTKSFNHYEYNDTGNYVTGLDTYNENTNKTGIKNTVIYEDSSSNHNITPISTSVYTTIKTLAVNIDGYEQIFNSNQVFVPTDLSVSKANNSTANVTVKVYNDVDDRTYEQSVGINTPAHPMFSLRHGEITATVNTSTNTVTSMTLRYVSDNE